MKRKGLRSLSAILLALVLLVSIMPTALAAATMYVQTGNTGRLNLRVLPSTSAESLGLFSNGTPVVVEYTSGEWAYVNISGQHGFMLLSMLTNKAPSSGGNTTAKPTNAPAHTENTTMYVSTGNSGGLNLRADASRNAKSRGVYANGTQVLVLGRDNTWAYVQIGAATGYMMLQYLSPYSPTPITPAPGPTLDPGAATTLYVSTGNSGRLNLREFPSTSATSLGLYANGTPVSAIRLANGWSQVIVDGQKGYMMTKYLSAAAPSTYSPVAPTATPSPSGPVPTAYPGYVGTMYVSTGNSGSLNLRESFSTGSRSLGLYPNGTPVYVYATLGAWVHVSMGGQTGYMMAKYLSSSKPAEPTPAPSMPGTAVVTHPGNSFVYLRSTANSNNLSNVLDEVPSGTLVEVLSWGKNWSIISYNGKQGYMVTNFLK